MGLLVGCLVRCGLIIDFHWCCCWSLGCGVGIDGDWHLVRVVVELFWVDLVDADMVGLLVLAG